MNSYLDHLATRNLDLTPSIQPRLPGLFEPLPSIVGMNWMDIRNDVETSSDEFATDVRQDPQLSHSPVEPTVEAPSLHETTLASSNTLPIPNSKTNRISTDQIPLPHPSNSLATHSPKQEEKVAVDLPKNKPLSLPGESAQQRNLISELLLSTNTPTDSPIRPEQKSDVIHSLISPEQEKPAAEPLSFLKQIETKLFPQVVHTQTPVELSAVSERQPNTKTTSSTPIPAQPGRMESVALPANSLPKQYPHLMLFEGRMEIIEKPNPSLAAAGPITVKPSIKLASLVEPGISQKTAVVSAQHTEAPPEPIVHVTIGRVEVRATPSSQTKRETPSKLPTMGLDEYLKQFGSKR